jgi:cation transport ATPase
MINEKTRRHPWATFVNNILLGINADRKTTQREQHFLPENLRYDFSRAKIDRDCVKVPLVKESRQLVKPGVQVVEEDFPLTPTQCGILLLVLSLIVLAYELIKKKTLRLFDVLLMLFTGLTGLVLFIMIFSEHPTTSINLQILVMNPIALFFIWPVWQGRKTIWFQISFILTIAFLIGGFWQDYAEGMEFVALCLLLRFLRHYNDK